MHLALVTASEPVMCYPERTSSARAFAASCHVQPQLTRVSEGRSLFTAYSLPWKPWPPSHARCFMLTTGGFVSSLGGRSVLERWQGWQAESELGAAKDCYGGRQLNSSRGGGLEWDFSLHTDCCWFCGQLMLAKCKSCRGSLWAVFGSNKPTVHRGALPMPFSFYIVDRLLGTFLELFRLNLGLSSLDYS